MSFQLGVPGSNSSRTRAVQEQVSWRTAEVATIWGRDRPILTWFPIQPDYMAPEVKAEMLAKASEPELCQK